MMRRTAITVLGAGLLLACSESNPVEMSVPGDGPSAGQPPGDTPQPAQPGNDPAGDDGPATGQPPQPSTDGPNESPGDEGAAAAGQQAPSEPPPSDEGEHPIALDECGLDTRFAGDEVCILPPPEGEGFQLHIGPSDYDNPDPMYILQPGDESTDNFRAPAGNSEDVYFYYRQFRMRPGAHHMIASQGSGPAGGRRIATSNNAVQDSPPGGVIPPENLNVGVLLPANAQINVSLHSINVTDEPILREVWVNFWYQDRDAVTQPASQLFAAGDVRFQVQPGEHTVLGPYRCDINANGRMLWFYGHRHANNLRFSAYRVRGEQRDLFYEGFDWEEVLVLEYSSQIQNPVPDRERRIEGGWSGPLDLLPGDKLEWECEVHNMTDGVLRFTNNTYTGEMCIMDAELIGTTCTGGGFAPPGEGEAPSLPNGD